MVIYIIMYISMTLTDLCFRKQKIKTKNTFARVVYSVLVLKMCWQNIKKFSLRINGAQSVRLEKGTIEFKKFFKQAPVHLKFMLALSKI